LRCKANNLLSAVEALPITYPALLDATRQAKKNFNRIFKRGHGHKRINARAVRALIEHTKDRYGVTVLYAGGKVAFAGDGNNATGPRLNHYSPGNGAPCGNGEPYAVPVTQVKQTAYGAFTTTPAIVGVVNKTLRAKGLLHAVRQQQKQLMRLYRDRAGQHKFVVNLDETPTNLASINTDKFCKQLHKWKKKTHSNMTYAVHTRHGFASINMKNKNNTQPQNGKNYNKTNGNTN